MSFATDLDKYLTTPPGSHFVDWCEDVIEAFDEDFFYVNEDWIMNDTTQIDKWFLKLECTDPKQAALIIERAFRLYKLDA